ncbi:hypothetical protein FRZ44_38070 [Hypericibacter terrae]|uniref:Uncharacterized protein n=1 Tax=Hypericibacter terrae TaxID=2602015 RepID=A0A5J6MR31_9PROT|nr:hypothetical protein [Hypericibacter terrae]QEX18500.1 hypothetical protein FRZ44_38070 [Hypericibacter terrae]
MGRLLTLLSSGAGGGAAASGLLSFSEPPAPGDQVTLDDQTYTYVEYLTETGAKAAAVLTFSSSDPPADGDTFSFNGTTYTYVSGAFTAPNQIAVTANAGTAMNIFAGFWNNGSFVGSQISEGSTRDTNFSAAVATDPDVTLTLRAKDAGTAANGLAVASTIGNAAWNDTATAGGADPGDAVPNELLISPTPEDCGYAFAAAIGVDFGEEGNVIGTGTAAPTAAQLDESNYDSGAAEVPVIARAAGAAGNNIVTTATGSALSWGDTHLTGGA